MSKNKGPRVLVYDIETAPILAYVWGLWENNVSLNQIESDWYVLSWSAKWLGEKKVMYDDNRNAKNIEDDKRLLKGIWKLLDEADIVITQNGISFDTKKLNARFILNGFKPPSSYKHIDTKRIAKKNFAFTSTKLEYMTGKLCKKAKKSTHGKFPGFSLWTACLAGNKAAWKEMEKYNKLDVISLEELYYKLQPWDSTVDFNLYHDGVANTCRCGSEEFSKNGFCFTSTGKYQRYICKACGHETRSKDNLFDKQKRKALRRKV